ncbi:uncharacterized protein K452DRAFT_314590 [Aplosporella prunicola CBS 121167]|uniref:NYN domain-containing protein n=1 Tax=Aplosporella prunicola CBS 121167 TaxID=1176127 RepID=A0A6A6BVR1_9PEZI|nr:uncharacterized protein K452DRAFT_314590 [Aplosporella prunicola CBS 121167]KAF2147433.1 hypothetical protein K452DRAFT_314590 [Aplosporella prunicola CBS 121167]
MTEPINSPSHSYMSPESRKLDWGLTQVSDLINTLSLKPSATGASTTPPDTLPSSKTKKAQSDDSASGLGNFSKLWEFLGAPVDAPPPALPPPTPPASEPEQSSDKEAYTSDGAIYRPSGNKGVKWRDGAGGLDVIGNVVGGFSQLAEVPEPSNETEPAAPKDPAAMTKTQRKKANRKARKLAESSEEAVKAKAASDYETDNPEHQAPARKASAHGLASTEQLSAKPTHGYNFRPRMPQPTPSTPQVTKATKTPRDWQHQPVPATEPKKFPNSKSTGNVPTLSKPIPIPGRSGHLDSSPIPFNLHKSGQERSQAGNSLSPKKNNYLSRTPPQQTGLQAATSPAPAGYESPYIDAILNQAPLSLYFQSTGSPNSQSEPKQLKIRDKDDRNVHFLLTLIRNFGEDKHWLAKPVQHVNHTSAPDGIHVFIDFSNIHIGFQNRIKTIRGLNKHVRIRRENIDFDAFVLLMERRRPVAKRVLVGSLPAIPAFEKAKDIGYETNILDKVFKARELTERQKFFKAREDAQRKGYHYSTSGDASSGSETTAAVAAQYAKEAWVEQGVDEILHLKILESVVDAEEPSTIVLATGDAAQAEYSQGFMRMVERALKKGWKVELVSWKDGISSQYQKREFRQKWGDRFRIIQLDDYVEDLLDT